MSWFEIQLTPAQVAAGEARRVQEHFETFYTQGGQPADMAMFSAALADQPDLTHLYFSPATEEHAEAFLRIERAQPCRRPKGALGLAAGDTTALTSFRSGAL